MTACGTLHNPKKHAAVGPRGRHSSSVSQFSMQVLIEVSQPSVSRAANEQVAPTFNALQKLPASPQGMEQMESHEQMSPGAQSAGAKQTEKSAPCPPSCAVSPEPPHPIARTSPMTTLDVAQRMVVFSKLMGPEHRVVGARQWFRLGKLEDTSGASSATSLCTG